MMGASKGTAAVKAAQLQHIGQETLRIGETFGVRSSQPGSVANLMNSSTDFNVEPNSAILSNNTRKRNVIYN